MANLSKFAFPGSQEEHRFKDGTVFRGTSSAWANEQNKSAYDIVIHTDTGIIYQYANNELVVVANKSTVFSGASSTVGGTVGLVPAPSAEQQDYVLYGNGTWGALASVSPIPDDTTENVTFGGSVISDDANENVIIS